VVEDSTSVGIAEWSVVGNNWGSDTGNWCNGVGNWESSTDSDWSGNSGLHDGWGRSVNNSVESLDWVGGVGDSPDSTIGLNKGVLSLDNISVTGLGGGLGVTGQGIGDRVSVVVLGVRVVWLSSNWNGGMGHSHGGSVVGSGSKDSSAGNSSEGKDSDSLEHLGLDVEECV